MALIRSRIEDSHRKESSKVRLLRSKSGTANDADWAGDVSTVASIAAEDRGQATLYWELGRGVATQIEFWVVSFDASNDALDRASCTFNATLIQIHNPPSGSAADETDELASASAALACNLHDKYRVQANGLDAFTIRMDTIAGAPVGHDHFEIYYREVVE